MKSTMRSRAACGVLLMLVLAVGMPWLGNRTGAQAQSTAVDRAALSGRLNQMVGKVCIVKYRDGDGSSSSAGTLLSAGEDWVVLDALVPRRDEPARTSEGGYQKLRAVYTRIRGQYWIPTQSLVMVDFDLNARVF